MKLLYPNSFSFHSFFFTDQHNSLDGYAEYVSKEIRKWVEEGKVPKDELKNLRAINQELTVESVKEKSKRKRKHTNSKEPESNNVEYQPAKKQFKKKDPAKPREKSKDKGKSKGDDQKRAQSVTRQPTC